MIQFPGKDPPVSGSVQGLNCPWHQVLMNISGGSFKGKRIEETQLLRFKMTPGFC